MNINFNLDNGQSATEELAKICKQHFQCENCPIKERKMLRIGGVDVTCSTQIIQDLMKNAGKNV